MAALSHELIYNPRQTARRPGLVWGILFGSLGVAVCALLVWALSLAIHQQFLWLLACLLAGAIVGVASYLSWIAMIERQLIGYVVPSYSNAGIVAKNLKHFKSRMGMKDYQEVLEFLWCITKRRGSSHISLEASDYCMERIIESAKSCNARNIEEVREVARKIDSGTSPTPIVASSGETPARSAGKGSSVHHNPSKVSPFRDDDPESTMPITPVR